MNILRTGMCNRAMTTDRLAEIEERYGGETNRHYLLCLPPDLIWLIDEVKQLRREIETGRQVSRMIANEHKKDVVRP